MLIVGVLIYTARNDPSAPRCIRRKDDPVVQEQYGKWLQSQQLSALAATATLPTECTLGNVPAAAMVALNLGRLIVTKSPHSGLEKRDRLWGPLCAGAFVVQRSPHYNGPKDPDATSIETIVAYGQSTRGTPSPAHVAAR